MAVHERRSELLDKEGQPLRAVVQQRGELGSERGAQDAGRESGGTRTVEGINDDLTQVSIPAQLGPHPTQGMPPRQVITAVRPNQRHGLIGQLPGEGREKF